MFIIQKKILIFFVIYFIIQLFLTQNHTLIADEGTHSLIGLFYRDILLNLRNFHSTGDIMNFAADYIIKYPKISPYYPPLYHFLLVLIFLRAESILAIRILNILLTILTSLVIYKICKKLLKSEDVALVSAIFFLSFSIIFYNSDKIMIDILQILTFSAVIFYYLKLRNKNVVSKSEMLKLSILLALSFLTKYFSVFLPVIILCDSIIHNKRLLKYFLFSIILSLIIISPYLFLFIKFKFYKLLFKVATTPHFDKLVYFNIFLNFGIIIGAFVALSTIWFIWKNLKNPLIVIWFFAPLILFMIMKDCDPRFAFILMPIYAVSCGFMFQNIQKLHSKKRGIY